MTDIKQIIKLIDQINKDCKAVLDARTTTAGRIQNEQNQVNEDAKNLVKGMKSSLSKYEAKHFESIKAKIQKLVDMLSEDYADEYTAAASNPHEFDKMSYEDAQKALNEIFVKINGLVSQLNNVDFDALVPPVKVVSESESFYTCTASGEKIKTYNCDSSVSKTKIPKPVKHIVAPLFVECKRGLNCIAYVTATFRKAI